MWSTRGTAQTERRAASGPHDSAGINLPTLLTDDVMQEGREDVWVEVPILGLSGVNFRPPGLRVLVAGY